MPHDIGAWFSAALFVLALAGLAWTGSTRARLRDLSGQLAESRAETTAMRVSLADCRTDLADCKSRGDVQAAQLTAQANDLDALGRVVTGEAHWVALGQHLDEHRANAQAHWAEMLSVLKELRDEMRAR